jgi:hypothetical protein
MSYLAEDWTPIAKLLKYETEKAMLEDLYIAKGMSISAMVKKLGYSQNSIRMRLIVSGIKLRPRGGPMSVGKTKFRTLTDEQLMELKPFGTAKLGDEQVRVLPSTLRKEKKRRGIIPPCTSHPLVPPPISTDTPDEATSKCASPPGPLDTPSTSSGIESAESEETSSS